MTNVLDKIYNDVAQELGINLEIVETVMHDKWQGLYTNLPLHTSVEDSGLGTFLVRQNTTKKRIVKLERYLNSYLRKKETETNEKKLNTLQLKINQTTEDINYLKTKLDVITVETNS